tara:strand:- start:8 stop:277 length:270 start_codon:yes stop_codon:yes gene_type:complete
MTLETEIYQILKKHRLSLKKREEVIVDLLDFINKREKQLNIGIVTKRLEWLEQQMDETPFFKQAYNNLNERHSNLLEAKSILDKEGLWL